MLHALLVSKIRYITHFLMLHVQCLGFIPRSNYKPFHTQGTCWSRLSIGSSQIYQETKGFAHMLRAKLLGGGRQILPGEFSFRLQKIPLKSSMD